MDKSWAEVISELQIKGMTYALIGEAVGCAASTIGDLASGRSQSPRAAAAFALLKLHSERVANGATMSAPPVAQIRELVNSRMSKRALRQKFGFRTDAHLAKVLGLPAEQVEGWGETDIIPALPQVMKLLGHEEQPAQQRRPKDPDANRIVTLEVA
ncbi:hypothetical protein CXF96_05425 [Stenotrophomonas sp. Betaine-02u-21]|uniref:hypothetical protein n=1 Tax=unclassified Stenotrophomonas TaxID=196198 RepID=UPI000C347070|nr:MULTISPECIES: hypothetical protein [unclassified Stenotrophomonas]PKH70284.1 hypothetical protein CXF90_15430 [Stenotrophomonas sp. Betaine-02u-23]PKH75177.1 hypothetical protein CXF96_05425 [Stenotrophomonas sp. Betaine-02u-21]PKH97600.1 hypothetical protein CXG43_01855 [Stenotrophomonas sp. Bg11-02]